MEWFTSLITQSPATAIIAMLVFILGGVINLAIVVERKFGFLGGKKPDFGEAFNNLNKKLEMISNEVVLTNTNHLSHLPDTERGIERIEMKLDKMNDTLVGIKVLLESKK